MTYVTCHQELKAKHFYPLLFGIRVCRDTQCDHHCIELRFAQTQQDQLLQWVPALHGQSILLAANTDNWPAHTLLVLQQKDSVPPHGTGRAVGLARSHVIHTVKQNKGVLIESETGKDIPTQGDKPSTACQGSLSLVRKCSRLKSILLQPRGGEKDVHRRLSFPVIYSLLNTKMALKLFI